MSGNTDVKINFIWRERKSVFVVEDITWVELTNLNILPANSEICFISVSGITEIRELSLSSQLS